MGRFRSLSNMHIFLPSWYWRRNVSKDVSQLIIGFRNSDRVAHTKKSESSGEKSTANFAKRTCLIYIRLVRKCLVYCCKTHFNLAISMLNFIKRNWWKIRFFSLLAGGRRRVKYEMASGNILCVLSLNFCLSLIFGWDQNASARLNWYQRLNAAVYATPKVTKYQRFNFTIQIHQFTIKIDKININLLFECVKIVEFNFN